MAAAEAPATAGAGLERDSSDRSAGEERSVFEYSGWVYHLGVNSIGHEYCHLRFLFIRGKYVQMFKRDPHDHPDIQPIRKGVVGPTLMVEDLGRRKVNDKEVYVLSFYNRLDDLKKGEIGCGTAGETRKWIEAFDHAKQQAEYELSVGNSRNKLSMEDEINLEGHRPRVRRYANELRKFIRIGQGPEMLLRQSSGVNANNEATDRYFGKDVDSDAVEAHQWKCVRTINGVRIFEDISESQSGKGALVKSTAVVDASADTVFDVILNLDCQKRYEWDMLTGDLEQVDLQDGHYDVVYGTFDPKYLTRWHSKRDFVFSRQWFRGQDGTYTILQLPAVNKKKPPRSGYRRVKINPSTWEIRDLKLPAGSNSPKCLVMQMLEIQSSGWFRWKKSHSTKFEKSVPYALLSQVAGLKEYISANPSLTLESATTTIVKSKIAHVSIPNGHDEETEAQDEFYDAIAGDSSSSSDDESDDEEVDQKGPKMKLGKVARAIASVLDLKKELDQDAPSTKFDQSEYSSSLHKGNSEADTNCWTSPSGAGFMIRGKNYLQDQSKVSGGDPLLKLLAVDWYKVDGSVDQIALHPKSLLQTEAGKKLPFVLVINLQVPAKPNYSLVLYYAADRPLRKDSLLCKFANGSDMFRDSRFKLIPSIVEGYWMVKRAVGTKACLLGKAVTCKYFRQDNFLEIDVDIGSSSVARSVIGLVLGYVTSLVVDLAILIEAKEEEELPEFILGTVRLNRIKLDSAVTLDT